MLTESEIKQLADECRNLSMICYANSSRERYARLADALEQMQQQVAAVTCERDELKAVADMARIREQACVALWRKDDPEARELVQPDYADLLQYLYERLKLAWREGREAESQLARMREACQAFVNEFDEWDDEPETEDSSAAVARNRSRKVYRKAKDVLSLSTAQPASETPAVRVVSSEVQSAIEWNRSAIDNSDRGPGKCPNCGGSLEGPLRGCRKCNTWYADIKPASNTPPCPPGHCDDCTGECPDGPPAELSPAASEQAPSEDARQKELDDALASVGFKKLASGVSPMQGYIMMMKAASEQAPAQESK
jgi:hypothetical protein